MADDRLRHVCVNALPGGVVGPACPACFQEHQRRYEKEVLHRSALERVAEAAEAMATQLDCDGIAICPICSDDVEACDAGRTSDPEGRYEKCRGMVLRLRIRELNGRAAP